MDRELNAQQTAMRDALAEHVDGLNISELNLTAVRILAALEAAGVVMVPREPTRDAAFAVSLAVDDAVQGKLDHSITAQERNDFGHIHTARGAAVYRAAVLAARPK